MFENLLGKGSSDVEKTIGRRVNSYLVRSLPSKNEITQQKAIDMLSNTLLNPKITPYATAILQEHLKVMTEPTPDHTNTISHDLETEELPVTTYEQVPSVTDQSVEAQVMKEVPVVTPTQQLPQAQMPDMMLQMTQFMKNFKAMEEFKETMTQFASNQEPEGMNDVEKALLQQVVEGIASKEPQSRSETPIQEATPLRSQANEGVSQGGYRYPGAQLW